MAMALLSVLVGTAAAASRSQELCWEPKDGYNAVSRMIKSPKSERRPEVFYFGEKQSAAECRLACEQEDECFAFTWMGESKGG